MHAALEQMPRMHEDCSQSCNHKDWPASDAPRTQLHAVAAAAAAAYGLALIAQSKLVRHQVASTQRRAVLAQASLQTVEKAKAKAKGRGPNSFLTKLMRSASWARIHMALPSSRTRVSSRCASENSPLPNVVAQICNVHDARTSF